MTEVPVTVDPVCERVTVIGIAPLPNVPDHVPLKGPDGVVGVVPPPLHESVRASNPDQSIATITFLTVLMIFRCFASDEWDLFDHGLYRCGVTRTVLV
jgi:hypothetical protein